ncbi:MAG: hypothetical protein ACU83O_14485 [Gammaproteobacteria bacterium]
MDSAVTETPGYERGSHPVILDTIIPCRWNDENLNRISVLLHDLICSLRSGTSYRQA